MKKTIAAALVLILLISGCQNKEKPQPTDDGMLPAPEEQVINNELPGISLASAKLQITQTAPVRIASETVRLSISEETLDGCTMDACEEAKKAGLKGTVILAGTKLNPGLSLFQLFTEESMNAKPLTTSKGSWNAEQLKEHQIWTNGTVSLVNMNNLIGRTEGEDQRTIADQMTRWVYDETAAVGEMLQDYRVPSPALFSDLDAESKQIENLKVTVAYLKQTSFPSGIERTFQSIDGLTLNGDGYVVSLSFNKKGKETVSLPVFIVQQYNKDTLKPESYFNLQDQTVLITKLSSDAVLEETPERKVVDVAVPFYEGQDLAERFANAVGSKEKKKDYAWAKEVVAQMRTQLVDFYANQIGK